MLHEDAVGDWEQGLWNQLFLSEIHEATILDWDAFSPVDISIVWELRLSLIFSLV